METKEDILNFIREQADKDKVDPIKDDFVVLFVDEAVRIIKAAYNKGKVDENFTN